LAFNTKFPNLETIGVFRHIYYISVPYLAKVSVTAVANYVYVSPHLIR